MKKIYFVIGIPYCIYSVSFKTIYKGYEYKSYREKVAGINHDYDLRTLRINDDFYELVGQIPTKISYSKYESLQKDKISKTIYIKRYAVLIDNISAEIDTFPDLGNKAIVKVNFKNEEEEQSFVMPKWFGKEIKENNIFELGNKVLINDEDNINIK